MMIMGKLKNKKPEWKKILIVNIINFFILLVWVAKTRGECKNGWACFGMLSIFSIIFILSLITSFFISNYFKDFKEKIIHGIFAPISLILVTYFSIAQLDDIKQPILDELFIISFILVMAYAGTLLGILINQIFSNVSRRS